MIEYVVFFLRFFFKSILCYVYAYYDDELEITLAVELAIVIRQNQLEACNIVNVRDFLVGSVRNLLTYFVVHLLGYGFTKCHLKWFLLNGKCS